MNYFLRLPSLPSCLRLIDKWPPQMWLFFSFIFHAQKNMRPIWLQPPCPELLQAIHETVWPSWTHQSKIIPKSLYSRDYSSLSLSFAPLRPFCLPAAGASCDPGPLSCTHGGNEGCWAACGFAGESLEGLKCVCDRSTAVCCAQSNG